MPAELWILGAFLALALLVGVPEIRSHVRLPAEIEIELVPDAQLDPRQVRHFGRIDAEAAALWYRPAFGFRATNLQGRNINRLYLNAADPALLLATCALADPPPGTSEARAGANYLEFVSRFEDGTTLTTRNVMVSPIFPRMPQQQTQDLRGASAAALKLRHDRKSAQLRGVAGSPVFTREDAVLDHYRDFHRRFCAYQAERGFLRLDPQARLYHATTRAALRGIANFVNPLADNFTWARFAAGLLLGSGLPAAAAALGGPASPLARAIADATGLAPALCAGAAQLAAFTLSGAAVGFAFESKCFVWGLLLGYLPLRVWGATTAATVGFALWMGAVAESVAQWRLRRETVA